MTEYQPLNYFASSNQGMMIKKKKTKQEKIAELVKFATPDVRDALDPKQMAGEKLPSIEQLALQRNIWAKKRNIMANKRTMLAYIRTGFTIANVARAYTEQAWATTGIIFMGFVAIEYSWNAIVLGFEWKPGKTVDFIFERFFDVYAFALVIIALICLGYLVETPPG